MKRSLTTVLLVATLAATLAGCTGGTDKPAKPATTTTSVSPTSPGLVVDGRKEAPSDSPETKELAAPVKGLFLYLDGAYVDQGAYPDISAAKLQKVSGMKGIEVLAYTARNDESFSFLIQDTKTNEKFSYDSRTGLQTRQ